MHLPKFSINCSKLSRFGCIFGVLMNLCQGKTSEDETKTFAKMLLHAFHDGISMPTMRALVISIFDECNFGMLIALNVIVGTNWDFQNRHGYSSLRQIFQRLNNAIRTGIYTNGRKIAPGNHALLVDDKERTLRNAICSPVYSKLPRNLTFRLEIRQQREM